VCIPRKYKWQVGYSMVYHEIALQNWFIPCHCEGLMRPMARWGLMMMMMMMIEHTVATTINAICPRRMVGSLEVIPSNIQRLPAFWLAEFSMAWHNNIKINIGHVSLYIQSLNHMNFSHKFLTRVVLWGINSNGRVPALHAGSTGIDTRILQEKNFFYSC